MKIAIFLPSLHGGGAEHMMLNLAEGFIERGHEVTFVLRKAEGPYMACVPDGASVIDLGFSGEKARASFFGRIAQRLHLTPPLMFIPLGLIVLKLAWVLRTERPDAVLSAMTMTNVTALLARRISRVPCRLVISERNSPSMNWTKDGKGRRRIQSHGARWTYPWADGITAVTEGVADDLCALTGLPKERVRVIYNPTITKELAWQPSSPVAV